MPLVAEKVHDFFPRQSLVNTATLSGALHFPTLNVFEAPSALQAPVGVPQLANSIALITWPRLAHSTVAEGTPLPGTSGRLKHPFTTTDGAGGAGGGSGGAGGWAGNGPWLC